MYITCCTPCFLWGVFVVSCPSVCCVIYIDWLLSYSTLISQRLDLWNEYVCMYACMYVCLSIPQTMDKGQSNKYMWGLPTCINLSASRNSTGKGERGTQAAAASPLSTTAPGRRTRYTRCGSLSAYRNSVQQSRSADSAHWPRDWRTAGAVS